MKDLNFIKIQAQGNDYIYFDFIDDVKPDLDFSLLAPELSNRHFGIGSDGIVLMLPSDQADTRMQIFNRDGSQAETCGSALRSIGWYLFQKTGRMQFTIETVEGLSQAEIIDNADASEVRVTMGMAELLDSVPVEIRGFRGYRVNLGNPHLVIPVEDIDALNLFSIGPSIQADRLFENGVNLDFINIISLARIRLRFWERGSGLTLACGSGTCAAAFWGISQGLIDREVSALVPGGQVRVGQDEKGMYLAGGVKIVFRGKIKL